MRVRFYISCQRIDVIRLRCKISDHIPHHTCYFTSLTLTAMSLFPKSLMFPFSPSCWKKWKQHYCMTVSNCSRIANDKTSPVTCVYSRQLNVVHSTLQACRDFSQFKFHIFQVFLVTQLFFVWLLLFPSMITEIEMDWNKLSSRKNGKNQCS